MSEEQKDQTISEIAKGVKTIKFWWPAVAVIGALLGVAISVTSTYDTKVAKKEDLKEISLQLVDLDKKMTELAVDFNNYKHESTVERTRIRNSVDSLGVVVREMQRSLRTYRRMSFATEIKKHGVNNLPTMVPIK